MADYVFVLHPQVASIAIDGGLPQPDVVLRLATFLRGDKGDKGDAGDAGPGAGPILTLQGVATGPVSGHQVVGLDDLGGYRYVSNAVRGDAFRVAGISTGAAAAGAALSVQTAGPLVEPSWSWTPDLPVFVGPAGALTQVVPTLAAGAAFAMVIGVALTATSISIRLNPPLFL